MEYGCIGEKLSHSFSKIIHNEICDYDYELYEIKKDELKTLLTERKFKAINVTIPYKQDVIPYLDSIDEFALKIGAVNTIVNKNGKLLGYNTDFSGMCCLIENSKIDLKNKKVLILGSGGTSKTAFAVASYLGAKEIYKVSRKSTESSISYDDAYKLHNDAHIIINTTPVGMYPKIGESAIDISDFNKLEGVVDAVYNPLRTALVTSALKRGIKAVGGLYMLVAQAVFAAELFTDKAIDNGEIDRIYKKILLSKENIVLTGMPGCGKTTIGKALAKELNKEFIDIDDEIVKETGKPITEIFAEGGEELFRNIETQVIKRFSALQNCVISTGGGAILKEINIDFLKENGRIFYIDRPLEFLVTTDDRPLSSNREMLKKRFEERKDIYEATADFKLRAGNDIHKNALALKEGFLNENFSN
ncbi:MAG: shikimate kinase [Acutalibacteraceae bacterium]|nr:shikimate kinase [Acutalibacteraceae bacterium]